MPGIPQDILDAMDGEKTLTIDQLRRLIEAEAKAIGLTYEQALERRDEGKLPGCPIGGDLSLLIEMLPRCEKQDWGYQCIRRIGHGGWHEIIRG